MQTHTLTGNKAPELDISAWVQGEPVTLEALLGKVILIEVFQMNCPGCFLHALPEVAYLHRTYADRGLEVIGLSTAFEDFDKNTLDNLKHFAATGEMIGEPLRQLGTAGLLGKGKIETRLDFRLAMDNISEHCDAVTPEAIQRLIDAQVPGFATMPDEERAHIRQRAHDYLQHKTHHAHTFNNYQLQGTPSSILIDRDGVVRDISFGRADHLETIINALLNEQI